VEVTRGQREDGTVEIQVEGELDVATAPLLREELLGAIGDQDVWVDLSKCSFMDSTGLRVIIEGARGAAGHGARLGITGLCEQPKQLFEITSLDRSDLLRFDVAEPTS
jgi:anti-sigma B factor antagonist